MVKEKKYKASDKLLKQRDILIPDDKTTYDAIIKTDYALISPNEIVSAISVDGVVYDLNLSGTIILESILNHESLCEIEEKFKNIFQAIPVANLQNHITEMVENLVKLNILVEV